jgi:spore coat protein U-like protein
MHTIDQGFSKFLVAGRNRAVRPRTPPTTALLIGCFASTLFSAPVEAAATCSTALGAMNFGTIDVLANVAVFATETVTVTCSGWGSTQTVLVCLGEGWDTAGGDLNNGRWLNAGGSYNLTETTYQDSGYSSIWGAPWDVNTSTVAYQLIVTTDVSGAATANFTGYGSIPSGNTTAPPGTYTSSATDIRTLSHVKSGSGDICTAIAPATYPTGRKNLTGTLSATINAACNISAAALDFGSSSSFISLNIDAAATITAQCTNTTPYSIGLDYGTNASGSQNRMRRGATSNYITYGLFTDSARSQAWTTTSSATSCTGGASTCTLGTGTGSSQNITVYGRVPPQTVPAIGLFTDSVVVTITF